MPSLCFGTASILRFSNSQSAKDVEGLCQEARYLMRTVRAQQTDAINLHVRCSLRAVSSLRGPKPSGSRDAHSARGLQDKPKHVLSSEV